MQEIVFNLSAAALMSDGLLWLLGIFGYIVSGTIEAGDNPVFIFTTWLLVAGPKMGPSLP